MTRSPHLIRLPRCAVRLGFLILFAVVVLHCAVTAALFVRAIRVILALSFAGATPGIAHAQSTDLLRTALLWIGLTVLALGGAALTLRQKRTTVRAAVTTSAPVTFL